MMKRFARVLFLTVVLSALAATSGFAAFVEGTDYLRLEREIPNARNTVIEIWSYDCPFCYRYDSAVIPRLLPALPAGVTFRPFHLGTRGKYGMPASELFAVLLVRDQENGLSDRELSGEKSLLKKAKQAYYQAYHDRKERWDAGAETFLQTGLAAAGLSREEFEAARTSPKVRALLAEWENSLEVAKIQGIPAFVINGRYLVYTRAIFSVEWLAALVKELSAR